MLTPKEADELKRLIDSMTAPEVVGDAVDLPEIAEGETITEAPVEITEAEIKKMFRGQVPEGFNPAGVELVRSPKTGDRVFMKYGEERRWIPDPDTIEKLGYTMGDIKEITDDEMAELKEGFGLLSAKLW